MKNLQVFYENAVYTVFVWIGDCILLFKAPYVCVFEQDSQSKQGGYSMHQLQGNKEFGCEKKGYLLKKSDGYTQRHTHTHTPQLDVISNQYEFLLSAMSSVMQYKIVVL